VAGGTGAVATEPGRALGDAQAFDLLKALVAIAPVNLEDPVHGRFEKPNYPRAADEVARRARSFGLATRRFDPLTDLPPDPDYHGVPRPNVIVDLERPGPERHLILAHYDVVPVPAEQLAHWKSPPHSLTARADGRLYGRGSNDDLGSGVVSALLAMKRLAAADDAPRSVRLLVCCDEETGGLGGIEAIKRHDDALPAGHKDRFLDGTVALIPDGSPHASAASSGLVFVDGSFRAPASVPELLALGSALQGLGAMATGWRSHYPSPDWPDHGAPAPVLTGRATLTRFDVDRAEDGGPALRLLAAHAENDASNQIARAVTLVFAGPAAEFARLLSRLRAGLPGPYRLESPVPATALAIAPGQHGVQIVGESAHAGYPHRGHNPVPPALALLELALKEGLLSPTSRGRATFSLDLRLIPEMTMEQGRDAALARLESFCRTKLPNAQVEAPLTRARGGYALPLDHPALVKLERILHAETGEAGAFGEYGGTDASSLIGCRTPSGEALPALVFGSMDRAAHIHEAEESVDPRRIAQIARAIERFVREP
jgi:acetylornithine deacetylase/succinyl-diaminopimelate desuccinylase-like protein